ncbi:MAG TPA: 1,2-phenylacetyl-CoA epoxidase subunit PaaD [Chitinophagaceae bacterium]|nr:1,2-phenylacetyl-CoA epoxidase subunit PaaD [Chitinophagaceae bacterium]
MVSEEEIWKILEEVKDPEVPVLSIIDLGVVRDVELTALSNPRPSLPPCSKEKEKRNEYNFRKRMEVRITITPTYSGCPAMDVISMDIRLKLSEKGYSNVSIQQQLSPAWTTDWMSDDGKQKLKEYGIAPPNAKQQFCKEEMFMDEAVQCPRCNSHHTKLLSQFGSTACKSMYRCDDCRETFDYFKCH